MSNHYDTLEVSPKASAETIRAAYRSLMQRLHPDKHPGDAAIASRAAEVTRAYEVLGDAGQRLIYDRQLSQRSAQAAAAQSSQQRTDTQATGARKRLVRQHSPGSAALNRRFLGVCALVIAMLALGWWVKQRNDLTRSLAPSGAHQPAPAKSLRASGLEPTPPGLGTALTVPSVQIDIPQYIQELRAPLLHSSHKPGSVLYIQRIDLQIQTQDAVRTSQLLRDTQTAALGFITSKVAYLSELDLRSVEGERLVNAAIAAGIREALRSPAQDTGWTVATAQGTTQSLAISTAVAQAIAEQVQIKLSSPKPYLIQ